VKNYLDTNLSPLSNDPRLQTLQILNQLGGSLNNEAPASFIPTHMEETEKLKSKEYRDVDLSGIRKPIMSREVEESVRSAISMYLNRNKWKAWGMHKIRKKGSAVLLKGPPGTGKTTIARWAAKEQGKKMKTLDVSTVCSGEPGESERGVIEFFEFCRENDCIIFMDECDSLLTDRAEISADGRTWQLSTAEQIMVQMEVFPNMIFAATNHEFLMDEALDDRFLFIIHVPRPNEKLRLAIWKQKWPQTFPLRLKEKDYRQLATFDLSGRQIENAICAAASEAIYRNQRPTLELFLRHCKREEKKKIKEDEQR